MQIFDQILIQGRLYLGDCLVMSGMVNYYSDRCEMVHLSVFPWHFKTLTSLYKENPRVRIVQITSLDDENRYVMQNNLSRIRANESSPSIIYKNILVHPYWDLFVYDWYELPYSTRYKYFRVPGFVEGAKELHDKLSQGDPYILIHRRPSPELPGGFPMDVDCFRKIKGLPDYRIIEVTPDITDDMMQYVELIKNAKEIHCVGSSFHCLVDGMTQHTNAELFYHDIRRFALMRINSKWNNYRWNMVEYGPGLLDNGSDIP